MITTVLENRLRSQRTVQKKWPQLKWKLLHCVKFNFTQKGTDTPIVHLQFLQIGLMEKRFRRELYNLIVLQIAVDIKSIYKSYTMI